MNPIVLTSRRGEMANVTITARDTGQQLTVSELALLLYHEGVIIVHCDVNEIVFDEDENQYYLRDDCNNEAWIDPARFEVKIEKEGKA